MGKLMSYMLYIDISPAEKYVVLKPASYLSTTFSSVQAQVSTEHFKSLNCTTKMTINGFRME